MNQKMKKRVKEEATRMLKTKETIREIAKIYHVSKSTVHKDLRERINELDPILGNKVEKILMDHAATKHVRGGESTKIKYQRLKYQN